jgi:hypothetical protein
MEILLQRSGQLASNGPVPDSALAHVLTEAQEIDPPPIEQGEVPDESELEEPAPKRHKPDNGPDLEEAAMLELAADHDPPEVVDPYVSNA